MLILALALTTFLSQVGVASIYTTRENGTTVACPGYSLRNTALTAAHLTLPCGTLITVTNLSNGKSVDVTVIDRGPYIRGRIVDLTMAAGAAIGCPGLCRVKLITKM